MRRFLTLWRRELESCFFSPVAYVFMVVFLAMTGWVFLQMVEGHVGGFEPLTELLYKVIVYFWMPILVTVITMRLFAEEKRSGTLETLMTVPVTEGEVVLGKYAGALTFFVVVTLPAVGFLYALDAFSPGIESIDSGSVVAGGVFTFALAAFCVAIGLAISLLTRSQIVAAICCFCGVLAPLLAGHLAAFLPPGAGGLVEGLAAHEHLLDASRGIVDTRPLVLYVSGAGFMIFAAIKALESRRWK
jgi:ABC-2 type transport system permease protein